MKATKEQIINNLFRISWLLLFVYYLFVVFLVINNNRELSYLRKEIIKIDRVIRDAENIKH